MTKMAEPTEEALGGARLRLAVGKSRRIKTFYHSPRPIDRNDRARIMFYAKAMSRRLRRRGSHGGPLTHAREKVLRSLLYDFMNWQDGRCFPSYERIAEMTGVARSVVGEALKVMEALGVVRIVNRIMRVRWHQRDGNGQLWERWRVMRTSNSYEFVPPPNSPNNPQARPQERRSSQQEGASFPQASSSGSQSGTSLKNLSPPPPHDPNSPLEKALDGMRARLAAQWTARPA